MTEDVLTFEELRQVQNRARESDTLQELDESFFERAQNYLELKQEGDGHLQAQEYRNAKNIVQDILDLRQKKLVKLAFLSVKSDVTVENMLPHEEELFQELEDAIGAYREERHEAIFEDGQAATETVPVEDDTTEEPTGEVEVAGDEDEAVTEEAPETDAVDREEETEPVTTTEDEEEDEEDEQEEEADDKGEPEEGGSGVDDILEFEGGDDDEEGEDADTAEDEEDAGETGDEDTDDEGTEPEDGKVVVEAQERVPEFMGTDLNAYGPFEEGEQIAVPEENAEVLEQQGKAERV